MQLSRSDTTAACRRLTMTSAGWRVAALPRAGFRHLRCGPPHVALVCLVSCGRARLHIARSAGLSQRASPRRRMAAS